MRKFVLLHSKNYMICFNREYLPIIYIPIVVKLNISYHLIEKDTHQFNEILHFNLTRQQCFFTLLKKSAKQEGQNGPISLS